MNFRDMTNMTNQELYKQAKSKRDLLFKRKKRLEQSIEQNPTAYSKFGLEKLQDIPMVSTSMGRVELKRSLQYLDDIQNMATTSARGAKTYQEKLLRKSLNIPDGRLNKKDRDMRDRSLKFIQDEWVQGRDVLSEFWKAFNIYKKDNMYRMEDSDQLLEEMTKVFNDTGIEGIEDLTQFVRKYNEDAYLKEQQTNPVLESLEDITKPDGW